MRYLISIICLWCVALTARGVERPSIDPSESYPESSGRIVFYFAVGQSVLVKDYRSNSLSFDKLQRILGHSSISTLVDSILIEANASFDGNQVINTRMALERANSLVNYIRYTYPHIRGQQIRVNPTPVVWDELYRRVEADRSMPYREEVLNIISLPLNYESKKRQIDLLANGAVARYITDKFSRDMRSAACVVFYVSGERLQSVREDLSPDVVRLMNPSWRTDRQPEQQVQDTIWVRDTVWVNESPQALKLSALSGFRTGDLSKKQIEDLQQIIAQNLGKNPGGEVGARAELSRIIAIDRMLTQQIGQLSVTEPGHLSVRHTGEALLRNLDQQRDHTAKNARQRALDEIIVGQLSENRQEEVERLLAPPNSRRDSGVEGSFNAKLSRRDNLPTFAIKTNTLYWLLLQPNIDFEFYMGDQWSLNLGAQVAWWDNRTTHQYYQFAYGNLELRYWLKPTGAFRGSYFGFHAGVGLYDLSLGLPQQRWAGYQGEVAVVAGLSYGYMIRLSRTLNMEFGLGVGLIMTEYRKYNYIEPHYVYQGTERIQFFGPTSLKVSLVWPLGNKTKKGDRR